MQIDKISEQLEDLQTNFENHQYNQQQIKVDQDKKRENVIDRVSKMQADINLKNETVKQQIYELDQKSGDTLRSIKDLRKVIELVVSQQEVQLALDAQEEKDRNQIGLYGMKDKRKLSNAHNQTIGQPVLQLHTNCLSCSGQTPLIFDLFKTACLAYASSNVSCQGTTSSRDYFIQIRQQLSEQAQSILKTYQQTTDLKPEQQQLSVLSIIATDNGLVQQQNSQQKHKNSKSEILKIMNNALQNSEMGIMQTQKLRKSVKISPSQKIKIFKPEEPQLEIITHRSAQSQQNHINKPFHLQKDLKLNRIPVKIASNNKFSESYRNREVLQDKDLILSFDQNKKGQTILINSDSQRKLKNEMAKQRINEQKSQNQSLNTTIIDESQKQFRVKSAINQKNRKMMNCSKYLNKSSFINLREDQIVLEGLSQNLEYVKINSDKKIPLMRGSFQRNDKFMEINNKKRFYDNQRKKQISQNEHHFDNNNLNLKEQASYFQNLQSMTILNL